MHKAVDDCSFSVEDGKITGFIGPNGAGKTTTLKMITGILEATEGSITLDGVDIKRNGVEAKKKIGFVSDNPDSFLRLKGLEYLNFMADIYDVPTEGRSEKIKEMAERFEMADALGDKILSYSHGMRQKIMVMGALLHSPSLWILDEPLTGLDPKAAFEPVSYTHLDVYKRQDHYGIQLSGRDGRSSSAFHQAWREGL